MTKRLIFLSLVVLFIAYAGILYGQDEKDLPPLHDGDLIFQTSWTDQSIAIGLASGSLYIHTGILKHTPDGWVVIHAANVVKETPLHDWVAGGILKRFAVYRDRDLTDAQAERVLAAARQYYGKPYDHYFTFGNDAIYCSELDYLSFKEAGVPLGTPQKIETLHINNRFVKKIIEQRWRKYPACQGKALDFEACYKIILSQELITPEGIASDPHLTRIFSNYP